MTRSVAIIGAGQIGHAAEYQFGFHGWDVTIHARSKPNWPDRNISRFEEYRLGEHPAPEADLVIDTIAFDEDDVARYDPEKVGRLIAISSASVYCDSRGRTLDEAAKNGFPEFEGPVTEDHSTVAPGPESYSTRKVRMENKALELFGSRATILRPCAIYGAYTRHPREWWFVKRVLDGRSSIPLAFEGTSQFHATSVTDMASAMSHMADDGCGGVFNMVDPDALTVAQIGERIASVFDRNVDFKLMSGGPDGRVGRTPWSVPKPFVVSGAKAEDMAYFIVGAGFDEAIHWLRDLNPADWRTAFPQLAAYPWDLFDYEAEDRFFDERL